MNRTLRHIFGAATASAALTITAPLFADKPANTGNPETPASAPSSYQSIETEIKKDQENLQAEADNEKATLQAELFKRVQATDGFNTQSRTELEKYLKANKGSWKKNSDLPPGLQKKMNNGGALPPGWQKKLSLGTAMPKDIYSQGTPLPKDIREKIPQPEGTEDIQIEDDIYRVAKKTRQIIDIISGPPEAP